MSAVDLHAEAHRLRDEHGWGARRIAEELGVSRYRAEQLLKRPLPGPGSAVEQPVAEQVAEPAEPVADEVAEPADEVADRPSAAAEPVADEVADAAEPVAVPRLPRRMSAQRIEIDLRQNRALSRDLAELAALRVPPEVLITQAVLVLRMAYRRGVADGAIRPGQRFIVRDMTVTPSERMAARPVPPAAVGC